MISHLQVNAWDILYGLWIGQSRQVSGLLSKSLGLDDTAHDLAGPGLGDILHEVDLVGVSDGAQYLADVGGDLFRELGRLSNAIPEYDECDDLLALDLIRLADNGCLCDLGVRNGGGLDLGRWRFCVQLPSAHRQCGPESTSSHPCLGWPCLQPGMCRA